MTYDILAALALFAFVSSITPGPNNLMLMASGANFGFRRSLPHMLGVALGFVLMAVIMGLGLGRLFLALPHAQLTLKICATLYMLYLAWKIAHAAPIETGTATGRPLSFLQAAAFQWVNPKAWAMALTAITVYSPGQTVTSLMTVAVVFGAINLPSVSSWVLVGQQMARILTNPARLRLFNRVMAGLLILSLYPVLVS